MSIVRKAREFLVSRAMAYRRVFSLESQDAVSVLRDLARFCRAHESTGNLDPHIAARLDGRREVWLRIQHHIRVNDKNLWLLYGSNSPKGDE